MRRYDDERDAYYDDKTGKWLEGKCPDKNCEFCKDRPVKRVKR